MGVLFNSMVLDVQLGSNFFLNWSLWGLGTRPLTEFRLPSPQNWRQASVKAPRWSLIRDKIQVAKSGGIWMMCSPCCWWRRRGGSGRTLPHSSGHSWGENYFETMPNFLPWSNVEIHEQKTLFQKPEQVGAFRSACQTRIWSGGCLPTIMPGRREGRSPEKTVRSVSSGWDLPIMHSSSK